MNIKLSKMYRGLLRHNLNKKNRKRLENSQVSILSSNCIGGVLYHELGLKFLSPTINLYMEPKYFIKFLKNPNKYYKKEMKVVNPSEYHYPVVQVEDIILHCVHYHTVQEVSEKWNIRFERINWDNIRIIMSERDGCTEQDIINFDKLPYKHKVVFVHREMPEIKSAIHIPGIEMDGREGHWVKPLTSYIGRFSGKRVVDLWDYVSFLNTGKIR